jgi:hypothetical protein
MTALLIADAAGSRNAQVECTHRVALGDLMGINNRGCGQG